MESCHDHKSSVPVLVFIVWSMPNQIQGLYLELRAFGYWWSMGLRKDIYLGHFQNRLLVFFSLTQRARGTFSFHYRLLDFFSLTQRAWGTFSFHHRLLVFFSLTQRAWGTFSFHHRLLVFFSLTHRAWGTFSFHHRLLVFFSLTHRAWGTFSFHHRLLVFFSLTHRAWGTFSFQIRLLVFFSLAQRALEMLSFQKFFTSVFCVIFSQLRLDSVWDDVFDGLYISCSWLCLYVSELILCQLADSVAGVFYVADCVCVSELILCQLILWLVYSM